MDKLYPIPATNFVSWPLLISLIILCFTNALQSVQTCNFPMFKSLFYDNLKLLISTILFELVSQKY